jgi:CRISPR-associated protein Csb1
MLFEKGDIHMELAILALHVAKAAAIRRRQRLRPVGEQGDKIFPPTYPGERNGDSPRHVFEIRRIDGDYRHCVLIDSVQSQANRLEEALLQAALDGRIRLPRFVVNFPGSGLGSVGPISSLEAPHRVFDAILRDSLLDGKEFRNSQKGDALMHATAKDATAILEASPSSLLFGVWNSTGDGGGLGAKFARAIVSEVIGVDVPVDVRRSDNSRELTFHNLGRRTGSRIDPLGVSKDVPIYQMQASAIEWTLDPEQAEGGLKSPKLYQGKKGSKGDPGKAAKINHGNIAPTVDALGVTCDYALQTVVITLAGLRRLRFGGNPERDHAARTYLAAMGLVALLEADKAGYALRSRCDLVPEGGLAPLQLIGFDGGISTIPLDAEAAAELHERAYEAAARAGFDLQAEPVMLRPQDKLVDLVRRSQEKARKGEGETDAGV